jgi:hypothetical protein
MRVEILAGAFCIVRAKRGGDGALARPVATRRFYRKYDLMNRCDFDFIWPWREE